MDGVIRIFSFYLIVILWKCSGLDIAHSSFNALLLTAFFSIKDNIIFSITFKSSKKSNLGIVREKKYLWMSINDNNSVPELTLRVFHVQSRRKIVKKKFFVCPIFYPFYLLNRFPIKQLKISAKNIS